jgi:hypothetical protein
MEPTAGTVARNATLQDLAQLLTSDQARKVDVVAPASAVSSSGGVLVVQDTGTPELTDDGVTATEGYYRPTVVCDEGLADKLAIPVGYLRRMRNERPDLYDANVNGWLHGTTDVRTEHGPVDATIGGDPRSFLLRCFREDDTGLGVARAFLSNGYKVVDNLDVLTAALAGAKAAGTDVQVESCDLTERRMYVRLVAPQVRAYAHELLRGYRPQSGWTLDGARRLAAAEGHGYDEGSEPVVFAGFVLTNSETGNGAFTIVPRAVIKVCANGLTFTTDAVREVHLGGRLEHGVVRYSEETQQQLLRLVEAKAKDAVATFLDVDYVKAKLAQIEEAAGVKVTKPADTVALVCKRLTFDQGTTDAVLAHFISGGQATAGGVLNAVTSVAQSMPDADAAHEVEGKALQALALAAQLA